jgi:hypothetical protein
MILNIYFQLSLFTQYSHKYIKSKVKNILFKVGTELIVDLEYIDISPDFTPIKHD